MTSSTVGLAYDPTQGKLLGSRWATLLRINPDGSGYTDLGGTGTEGLAYDRVNNVLYGALNGAFFTMNKDTGAKIADQAAPGCDAEGLAFRATPPTVFAVCSNSGNLLAYDVGGGTWSVVGAHGLGNLGFGSGLAYDPHLDVLYLTGGLASPNLYWLDPGTGASTLIGTTGLASTNGGLEYAY